MAKKNITIENLAKMIQKGFENTVTKEQFSVLENEVKVIRKHQIAHTIYRDEFEKLEERVKEIENMLGAILRK
ncbi:MAG: hypothetical protein AAB340_02575 [Patescibacteria group bacterium]